MIIKYYEGDPIATPELRAIKSIKYLLNEYRREYACLVKIIAYLMEELEGQDKLSDKAKQTIFGYIKHHKDFDQRMELEHNYGNDGVFYEMGCYSKLDPLEP